MPLRRIETEKLTPDQFLEQELKLGGFEEKSEFRKKAACWIFPTITLITLWGITLVTLSIVGLANISESLMKWLISETIVTVLGYAGIMISWAFKK
jgi:hypothetical protein